jgi:hypothetical protein
METPNLDAAVSRWLDIQLANDHASPRVFKSPTPWHSDGSLEMTVAVLTSNISSDNPPGATFRWFPSGRVMILP